MPLVAAIAVSVLLGCVMLAVLLMVGVLAAAGLGFLTDFRQYVDRGSKTAAFAKVVAVMLAIVACAAVDVLLGLAIMQLMGQVT